MLPSYRQSYDLVDNALTPLEEAALAHVLCSPDTSYGDVAGQMFVVSEKHMYVCMYVYIFHTHVYSIYVRVEVLLDHNYHSCYHNNMYQLYIDIYRMYV